MADVSLRLNYLKNEIYGLLLFPDDLAETVFCYSVTIGDLLLYMPLVFPGPRDKFPYVYYPISGFTMIKIDRDNCGAFLLKDRSRKFEALLENNTDPLCDCLDQAEEGFFGIDPDLMFQIPWFYEHIMMVANECLAHFLKKSHNRVY